MGAAAVSATVAAALPAPVVAAAADVLAEPAAAACALFLLPVRVLGVFTLSAVALASRVCNPEKRSDNREGLLIGRYPSCYLSSIER